MEKVLSATWKGKYLTLEEPLEAPMNTRCKVIITTDETEQRETWEYLKQALDEDRLSDRRLFP